MIVSLEIVVKWRPNIFILAKLCYLFLWWQETVLKPYGLEWNLTQNGIMFLISIFIFTLFSFDNVFQHTFLLIILIFCIIRLNDKWYEDAIRGLPLFFILPYLFFTENFWRVIGNSFSVCAHFPHRQIKYSFLSHFTFAAFPIYIPLWMNVTLFCILLSVG